MQFCQLGEIYPFVASAGEQQRDNEHELRLKAQIGQDLPVEPELDRWFPSGASPFETMRAMPRALMITGDAAEDLDAMYPLYRLREAGWDVDVAAPTRRPVQLVVHDFEEGFDAYSEKPGRRLPVDLTFAEAEAERYGALVIPGGRAPEYIRTDPDVRRITEHFFANDLPVGTICHGPQVPAVYGLLQGRRTAAFPPLQGDMENAGATFVDAPDVVDANMVSCRGWPDMPEWSRAFIAVLERAAVPA